MKQTAGLGCAILFLLPFAGFGLFMTWWTAQSIYDYARMTSWVEVPATLTRLEEKHGDETTGVEAEFSYEYAGREYTGERVAIFGGSDNIGGFQRRLFKKLNEAKQQNKPVPCFVNPNKPSEAILNRNLRPEMVAFQGMFALVFGGVGVGGIVGSFWYRGTQVKQETEKQAHPEEPWLWKPEWQSGVIKSNSATAMVALAGFALFWNLISWTVFLAALLDDQPKDWFVLPIVGLFPLVGTGLAIGALTVYLRWRRFKGSHLRLASVPGVIGGKLTGVVVIPRPIAPDDGFEVRLVCGQEGESGDDSRTEVLFERSQRIGRTLQSGDAMETNVPVVFIIPSSALATNEEKNITWTVQCKAKLPGPDLDLQFEVPVFLTADSQDGITVDEKEDAASEFAIEEPLAATLARQGIRMERGHHPDETIFRSPPARHLLSCISMGIFATIWTGVCVALCMYANWFPAFVCTIIAAVIIPSTLSMWLSTIVLTIRRNRWEVRSGWWPILWHRVEFAADEIRAIDKHSTFSSNDNKWHSIRVHVHVQGKKKPVVVASQLTDRRVERLFMAEMRERAGLEASDNEADDQPLDLDEPL